MNYYFSYAIRCIIRRFIYFLTKPKYLLIIVTSIIVIFLLSNYTTVFGWEGDNDYTDKNATIITAYDSIASDLVNRMQNSPNSLLDSYLTDGQYSYYLYYGAADGSDMLSAQQWNTNYLYIAVYKTTSRTITATAYDRYQGMTTNIYLVTNIYDLMRYNGNTFEVPSVTNGQYIPSPLLAYHSSVITNYYNNSVQNASDNVVSAINQQTNTIQQQTQVIEEQTEAITSTDFDENSVSIDSSSADVDNSTQTNLISTIFTSFNNSIQNPNVEYINIPMPHTTETLSIPSDLVSSRLGSLVVLINAFWYYVFGFYAFKFINNLIIKIKDGSILDGYTSSEVITSDMM